MAQSASPDVVVVGTGMAGLMCAYGLEITDVFLGDLVAEWPDLESHLTHTVVHCWPTAGPYCAPRGRLEHEVLRQAFGRIRFPRDYLSHPSMHVAAMRRVTAADSLQAGGT